VKEKKLVKGFVIAEKSIMKKENLRKGFVIAEGSMKA
jgi:hypothetical protein